MKVRHENTKKKKINSYHPIQNKMKIIFFFLATDSPSSTKNADDVALSESELESRRAALLAQLNMQIDE